MEAAAFQEAPQQMGQHPSLQSVLDDEQLGGAWDVDTVVVKVHPNALSHFGPVWLLGGNASRHRADFSSGLELCSAAPWTLRVQPKADMEAGAKLAWQARFGARLIDELSLLSLHPILLPPPTQHQQSLYLCREPRQVHINNFILALNSLQDMQFDLYVCRYGMKMEAGTMWTDFLLPANDVMCEEEGVGVALAAWHSMVLHPGGLQWGHHPCGPRHGHGPGVLA